jgi:hypothetical protein
MSPVRARLKGLLPPPLVEWSTRLERLLRPSKRAAYQLQAERQWATELIRIRSDNTVLAGPFAGLKYVNIQKWSSVTPLLLGTYEQELFPIISSWDDHPPGFLVDVGCAEGYYAVGLAVRYPELRVVAFDTDEDERKLCLEMAQLNGVADRLSVFGECTPEYLEQILRSSNHSILIMDCEGCEAVLLNPALVPALRSTEIVVELHDFCSPHVSDLICERFGVTHKVSVVEAKERTEVPDIIQDLPPHLQRFVVDEHRPRLPRPMSWAHLVPTTARDNGL